MSGTNEPQVSPFLIGLAVGEGTGPELALVFRRAVEVLAAAFGIDAKIIACPQRLRTFGALMKRGLPTSEVVLIKDEDCIRYEGFLRDVYGEGCRVVFRTAINAESLYQVRERLRGVKMEVIPTPYGELFLVRDAAQGFYTGSNDTGDRNIIRRTCEFRRDWTEQLLDYAHAAAAAHWGGPQGIDHFLLAYKFHLLDNRFAQWVDEYSRSRNLTLELFQPDTMNRHLLRGTYHGRLLIVGANEWLDIAHLDLLARYGMGPQENRHSRNVYLARGVEGLVEYQTVHGSADDIAGRGLVNPVATLRAAADLFEHHGRCAGAVVRMHRAIERSRARGLATPDLGGHSTTDDFAADILDCFRSSSQPPPARDTALLVVDMQNDLCAPGGCFDRLGLIDCGAMQALASRIAELIEWSRRHGLDVIFTRMLADPERQPENMVERNRRLGRIDYLREGHWGADFFGVSPMPGEPVVTKFCYDAFLGTELERRLHSHGVQRLLFGGVFTDVCVDATARTAFQLGFRIAIVRDATAPLHYSLDQTLAFMEQIYGAQSLAFAELPDLLRTNGAACTRAGAT
ncbi:MAG: isochorismatase family protein [Acidobacteriota bacterium]